MATFVSLGPPSALDPATLQAKQERLLAQLTAMGRVIVAYSGGTDSAYLAWAAHAALGERAIAITADSASIPESHKRDAEAFARECGHPARIHRDARIRQSRLRQERSRPLLPLQGRTVHAPGRSGAASAASQHIVYGVNVDDLGDYRPGQRAAKLHQVKAPLVDAGLTKAEIREFRGRPGSPPGTVRRRLA